MHIIPFTLLTGTLVLAQDVMKDSSFGYEKGISPNSFGIPGWTILGEGYVPQLLSDKVILTPPYGDNKRGALWTENKNTLSEWTAQLDFRAGGTERGSGNMALWYAADGATAVSTSSIYTVGKFDGLALVIDTASGTQKIRGFLNDGTTDYKSHPNVDSLAFGHCDYNYRNLGRPSSVLLKATGSGLEVTVDDKTCFSTSKVTLPQSYNFGLTAASGGPPDSFEAFKFLLKSTPSSHNPYSNTGAQDQQYVREMPNRNYPTRSDTPSQTSDTTQFLEQLNLLQKSLTNLFTELQRHTTAEEGRYNDILSRLPTQQSIQQLETRLSSLESKLKEVSNSLSSADHTTQFAKISRQIEATHQGMTEHLPGQLRQYIQDHTPRVGFMIFSFIAFQCGLVVLYVFYKKRRWGAPKKYL
jgi:lectin, mannose-binding 1